MSRKKRVSQSEIDGVQYRRAKMWQIILVACNALVGMSVYSLIGMASYNAYLRTLLMRMISCLIKIKIKLFLLEIKI